MHLNDCFERRSAAYLRNAASVAHQIYDDDGNWISESVAPVVRERYWLSLALYGTGHAALADAIVRKGDLTVDHQCKPRRDGSTFDIFHSNIAAALLVQHGSKMAADVREKLSNVLAEAIAPDGGDRQPCFQFHGYNDNMPAKAAMGLILGGELLGDDSAVAHGVANLRGLRAMLVRRGTVSEYNSPTYSAVTLHALAEIAEHARSEEAREIGQRSEERLWIDLAARFHPEMGVLAGPYSRMYTVDSLASVSCIASLFWFVLGDVIKASPMRLFEADPALVVHHQGDYPFNIAQMCWFAAGSYHVPEVAGHLFGHKTYPFTAVATCEVGNADPDFPAHQCAITSYLQPAFTLGTAENGWLGSGQCAPYFVTYKQRDPVGSYRDVGTVYTKLVVNDEVPGYVADTACASNGEEDNLQSHSGVITVQSESTALVLTHPHLSLASAPDSLQGDPVPLTRLSELIVFPSHYANADELMVGGCMREGWNGTAATGEWIACRRGRMLIAFLPVAYSRDFGQAAVTLERINNYEVIRSTFYEGVERRFTRDELRFVCGGFVAEHASVDEYPSLAAFVEDLLAACVSDFVYTTRRSRYSRPSSRKRPALDIETSWSPAASTVRYLTVNGRVIERPRVLIDGIDEHDLPFLNTNVDPTETLSSPYAPFPISWNPG